MKIFHFLLISILFSCAGITPLNSTSWKHHYSQDFLSFVEKISNLRKNEQWDSAIDLLMSVDEVSLSVTERAFRRNLIGVHYLKNKKYEKSIFHFTQAISSEVEDTKLISTLYLNLANANYQLGLYEESLRNLSKVNSLVLGKKGRKSYFELNYEMALYIEDQDLQFNSLVGYLNNLEEGAQSTVGDEKIKAFNILIKMKSIDEQINTAYSLLNDLNEASLVQIVGIIERSYFSGGVGDSKKLMESLESKINGNEAFLEKLNSFKERVGAFSTVDGKAIGVVLPLSGKYKKFGVRILRGLQSSFNQELANRGFRLVVEDSKSSVVAGKYAIEKLIKKYKVSSIIAGIEPSSSTAYWELLSGRQVLYISLAKIISNNDVGRSLAFEVAGSIESEVRSALSEVSKDKEGSKAAVLYSNDLIGRRYLKTFWELAREYNVTMIDAISYDPKEKDLRSSVKDLLGLGYKRERIEELEILERVYSTEKSVIRRVQKLRPLINFDWVFVPSTPIQAAQIIPSFSYYDAPDQTIIGTTSWRSKVIKEVSRGKIGVNFNVQSSLMTETQVNSFEKEYGYRPKLPESRGISAAVVLAELFKDSDVSTVNNREDLRRIFDRSSTVKVGDVSFNRLDDHWVKSLSLGHFRRGTVVKGVRVAVKVEEKSVSEEEVKSE